MRHAMMIARRISNGSDVSERFIHHLLQPIPVHYSMYSSVFIPCTQVGEYETRSLH